MKKRNTVTYDLKTSLFILKFISQYFLHYIEGRELSHKSMKK